MRVGLNATCLENRPSGARQRFVGIYTALAAARPDIEFVVYEPEGCPASQWLGQAANLTARPMPIAPGSSVRRLLSGWGRWSKQLSTDRLDLFECFHMPMVEAPDCPTILTIHDARHIHYSVGQPRRLVNRAIWHRALSRAARTITVSQTMRDEILAFHPKAKVDVVYNGIDVERFANLPPPTGDFILAVGHLETRKNYPLLLRALRSLRDHGRRIDLVIVGNDGGERAVVERTVADLRLADQVSLRVGIDDGELLRLYGECRLVVFPSTYEGFGIPVLEAMASGRPLATSNIPVFRELGEGAAAMFPADDPVACAGAIASVLDDPTRAAALVARGRHRVESFTFARLAGQVSAIYQDVLTGA